MSFASPFSGGRFGYSQLSGFTNTGPRGAGQLTPNGFAQYDYSLGLNIKKLPQQLDDRELTVALNVYLRAEGGVEMRKGITPHGASRGATPMEGGVRFFQNVVHGVAQANPVKMSLGQQGGTLINLDTGTQIGATNALGASAKPWSVTRVFDPDYAGGATDCLVICTGSGGPYLFDGTTITAPASWANVAGARWCCMLNGILWFGGIPIQPNLLYGTQVGHPETLVFYDLFTMSAPITGLCAQGTGPQAGLVIGMNTGICVLYGTGPQNWYMQDIPMADGVVAGRTMIAVNGVVYFLGRLAIYAFDGSQVSPISDQVEPWILNDPLYPDFPMNGDRSTAFAWFYNNRLYVGYDSGNLGYPTAYLCCHLNVNGAWSIHSGPKLIAAFLLDAPGDGINGTPLACVVLDATTGQAYDWDTYADAALHTVSDNGVAIQAICLSKYFKIGLPGTPKALTRLYPELFTETFAGSLQADTDYGSSSVSQLLSPQTTVQMLWDAANWDEGNWSPGAGLQYLQQRVDVNITAEAFAFGIFSNDTNPPWRFVGVTGEYAQKPAA